MIMVFKDHYKPEISDITADPNGVDILEIVITTHHNSVLQTKTRVRLHYKEAERLIAFMKERMK